MIALKCPICGAPVPPSKGRKPRMFCSLKCAMKAARRYRTERGRKIHRKACAMCGKIFMTTRPDKRSFCSRRCGALSRCPDGKTAKAFVGQVSQDRKRKLESMRETAPVTVEVRGGVRIETRGQRCIGWRSSGYVSHS